MTVGTVLSVTFCYVYNAKTDTVLSISLGSALWLFLVLRVSGMSLQDADERTNLSHGWRIVRCRALKRHIRLQRLELQECGREIDNTVSVLH